ncbi:hypothetical protein MPTK1_2g05830 [Marchantia polymorpha subsp. ruderalis]|uniref:Uncharacterized protein n=1 Tax=Marchantia polymorpha TaxID=3197 RepID=A0A2R6XDI6_MARPO|nr:hypothetical protein MARPO_0021s0039 [Marchantia polymorpha]BBN01237.1 hypothetical protein Mp_2g05830 [Marchantia polymorpha subsp. ruderalis]|eukprot:PTQ44163.1 hypothetical protein MARPO_0021s0039 [Marchantia polymorpha]
MFGHAFTSPLPFAIWVAASHSKRIDDLLLSYIWETPLLFLTFVQHKVVAYSARTTKLQMQVSPRHDIRSSQASTVTPRVLVIVDNNPFVSCAAFSSPALEWRTEHKWLWRWTSSRRIEHSQQGSGPLLVNSMLFISCVMTVRRCISFWAGRSAMSAPRMAQSNLHSCFKRV